MKEISQTYHTNPKEFCRLVPKVGNREHARASDPPTEVLNDPKFYSQLEKSLNDMQIKYVKSLLDKTSQIVENVEKLRKLLSIGFPIFDPKDPDTPHDIWILKRIFF